MHDKFVDFKVRSLTEADSEAVSKLDSLFDNNILPMLDSEGFAWGAFLRDKLIGCCTIGGADELEGAPGFSEYPGFSSSDCYLLSDVFIDPDYRGNGYAVELIKEVIKQATEDQPEHVFLSLLDPALSSLYQKLGFQNIDAYSMVLDKKDLSQLFAKPQRILSDIYWKNGPRLWDDDVSTQFNQISTAVNAMFGWLYENKILQQTAFELRDYSDATYFTVDMQDLLPYRKQMEASGLSNANLALKKIFDIEYEPCMYSGAFTITSPMSTFRDFDGTVERSWESHLVQYLDSPTALDILSVREKEGVKRAMTAVYANVGFKPSDLLPEKEALDARIQSASARVATKPTTDNPQKERE